MGIQNLLKNLSEIEQKQHVSAYSGKRVAIDGYCWLHKAVYTCKKEMAQGQGLDKLISYVLKRVNLLISNNVTPVIVFDGGKLHMKKSVEEDRQKNREKYKEMAEEYMKEGDEDNAVKMYGMSIDITPKIAHKVIKALRLLEIEYYVAPYEADAQLAYLWFQKHVDVVFTEDSDLLAFGVKKVFFKMDPDGNGVEIDLDRLHKVTKKSDFSLFTQDMFLITCILSGCDYLDSVKGIGFVRTQKLVEQCGEIDTFHQVLGLLQIEPKAIVPDNYEEDFLKAFLTFKFQRVYCPKKRKLVMLTDQTESEHGSELNKVKDTSFLGKELSDVIAQQIASGDVDPITYQPFPPNTEEEEKIIERVAKRKNNPTKSFKSLVLGGESSEPKELPKFLKNNPHPHYIDLWNKHPKLFWKEYNDDKANGTVKYVKREKKAKPVWVDFSDVKFKGQKERPPKRRLNPEEIPSADYYDQEEGYSPKASKAAKKRVKDNEEAQLEHDLEMEEGQREDAIDAFIKKTDYNQKAPTKEELDKSKDITTVAVKKKLTEKERLDMKTAKKLKKMREEEMQEKLKKKEDKLKRIQKYHEKKRAKEDTQKKFMMEMEENMKIAQQVKSGQFQGFIPAQSSQAPSVKSGGSSKFRTLSDVGGNSFENDMLKQQEFLHGQQSTGFQVFASPGKKIQQKSTSNENDQDAEMRQMMSSIPITSLSSPALKSQLLMNALAFGGMQGSESDKKHLLGKDGNPSKEFEKEYLRVMNPDKYKKKYGHLDKQKLMPPSYLMKKQRKGKKDPDEELQIQQLKGMMMPLSMIARHEHEQKQKDPKSSYFDQLGKGKCLTEEQPISAKSQKKGGKRQRDKEEMIEKVAPGFSYRPQQQQQSSKQAQQAIPLGMSQVSTNQQQINTGCNSMLQKLALERMQRKQQIPQ